MEKSIQFQVPEFVCENCTGLVKNCLHDVLPIDESTYVASVSTQLVSFKLKASDNLPADETIHRIITDALGEYGYSANFDVNDIEKITTPNVQPYIVRGVVGVLSGTVLAILMASGVMLSFWAMSLLVVSSTALSVYLGYQTYKSAFYQFYKANILSMDALFTVSTVIALVASLLSLIIPGFPMMLDTPLLIFGFRFLGIAVEMRMKRMVEQRASFSGLVQDVHAAEQYCVGQEVVFHKGAVIPVDGECLSEVSYVIGTKVTGVTHCVPVVKGSPILAGMVVDGESDETLLTMKVTKRYAESNLVVSDHLLSEAKKRKAQRQKLPVVVLAQTLLKYFVPTVLLVAIAAGALSGSLMVTVGMLVSACPCALAFVMPLAMNLGIAQAKSRRAQFNSTDDLQSAANIDVFMVDLNGTLTKGTPEIIPAKTDLSDDVLTSIYYLEKTVTHAIGRAIISYIANKKTVNVSAGKKVDNFKKHPGGLSGDIDGVSYQIGDDRMMMEVSDFVAYEVQAGEQVVYVAKQGHYIGKMVLKDDLRPDAIDMIRELKKLVPNPERVELHTGSKNEITARWFAEQVGIKHVYSGETSQQKYEYVVKQQSLGHHVGMIGDAENDAPAVAASDIGIVVNRNPEGCITRQEAGLVIEEALNKPVLLPVVDAIRIAKQTMKNIQLSLGLNLTYNSVVMLGEGALSVLGMTLLPVIGELLMVLQVCGLLLVHLYQREQPLSSFEPEEKNSINNTTIWKLFSPADFKSEEATLAVVAAPEVTNVPVIPAAIAVIPAQAGISPPPTRKFN